MMWFAEQVNYQNPRSADSFLRPCLVVTILKAAIPFLGLIISIVTDSYKSELFKSLKPTDNQCLSLKNQLKPQPKMRQ